LTETLCYKPESHWFCSRWCHRDLQFIKSFRPHCGCGVNSVADRNEYQEYFLGVKCGRCVGLTTLSLLCADWFEIWEPQTHGTLKACPGIAFIINLNISANCTSSNTQCHNSGPVITLQVLVTVKVSLCTEIYRAVGRQTAGASVVRIS
jgi:hypothetical protein